MVCNIFNAKHKASGAFWERDKHEPMFYNLHQSLEYVYIYIYIPYKPDIAIQVYTENITVYIYILAKPCDLRSAHLTQDNA